MIEHYAFGVANPHVQLKNGCEVIYPKENVQFYYVLNMYVRKDQSKFFN